MLIFKQLLTFIKHTNPLYGTQKDLLLTDKDLLLRDKDLLLRDKDLLLRAICGQKSNLY